MNKRDYLIAALKSGAHHYADWLVSIFCMFDGESKEKPYAYQLSKTAAGYFYLDLDFQLQKIEGADPAQPLFYIGQGITVTPEDCIAAKEPQDSTVGTLVVNYILLIYAFGDKIAYINKKINIGSIEQIILQSFQSTPKEGEARQPGVFYADEYVQFGEACFHLTSMTQICTIGATEKSITAPDGIKEFKAQLQKEYAGRLSDPASVAEMNDKLQQFDRAWRKGDGSEDSLLTDKATKIVRQKKYLQLGVEQGVGKDATKLTYLGHSLDEGHTIDSFAAVNSTQRIGSFARGAETMLGGVQVKEAFRASRSYMVVPGDCGTKLGLTQRCTPDLADYLKDGYWILDEQGASIQIKSAADIQPYLGKVIRRRSPMYCQSKLTDYCSVCVGPKLSLTPAALPTSFADYGNVFMKLSMAQNHGAVLAITELDPADWLT